MLQAIPAGGHVLRAIESVAVPDTDLAEIEPELVTSRSNDQQIEAAAGRPGLEPSVSSHRWQAAEQNGHAE